MSGEMISIGMIVDKHQYYTVMVLDSQAWSPRIITNLPRFMAQRTYMASKIFTHHLS